MAFYTDPQGRPRPITARKGGAGATAAAVAVGALVLAGLGGADPGGGPRGDTLARRVEQRVAPARPEARKGHYEQAWRRAGLRAGKKLLRRELACAPHSFGQVRVFLLRTPCRSLRRALLPGSDGQGNTVVVSVAWVRMSSAAAADRLRRLEDRDGTGDISPLDAELLHLAGLRFTAHHYASRRSGPLLVIAEAEPAAGHPSDETLLTAAHLAVELPPL